MNTEEGQTPEFDLVWDQAIEKLDQSNEELSESCPVSVKNYIRNESLFNSPIFCVGDDQSEYKFVVGSVDAKQIYYINYELVDEININWHTGPAFDKTQSPLWLYDEFHKVDNHFEHHIVFSDGREYVIPFIFFQFRKTSWFED